MMGILNGNLIGKGKELLVDSAVQMVILIVGYNGFVAGLIQQPTVGISLALGSFTALLVTNIGLSIVKDQVMYKKIVRN